MKSCPDRFKLDLGVLCPLVVCALCALAALLTPRNAVAQWRMDGMPLRSPGNLAWFPTIVADGAGGFIATWEDARGGAHHIYAQRFNATGVPQWATDGVALCTARIGQDAPVIVADGSGGAIIAWSDTRVVRTSYIYAQRINAAGVPQWAADGVALCTVGPNFKAFLDIASDGAGGAIVAWYDLRHDASGMIGKIYAQRVNAAGQVQWATNGLRLCGASGDQLYPMVAPDGVGGAFFTWRDNRRTDIWDVYAQRVNASGQRLWGGNGVAVCVTSGWSPSEGAAIAADGGGGVIATWQDERAEVGGIRFNVYCQRLNSSGVPQWTTNGVRINPATNGQDTPSIVAAGAAGAIVAWRDDRGGGDIYAQRINTAGAIEWDPNGVIVCRAAGRQEYPTLTSDGSAGAIVAWQDYRNGNSDIFCQRVLGSGAVDPAWPAGGRGLCMADADQELSTSWGLASCRRPPGFAGEAVEV